MTCPTGKRQYSAQIEADISSLVVTTYRPKGRAEGDLASYRCEFCGAWHWGHLPSRFSSCARYRRRARLKRLRELAAAREWAHA
jgi:rRNA maturation protein Nop10